MMSSPGGSQFSVRDFCAFRRCTISNNFSSVTQYCVTVFSRSKINKKENIV